MWFAAHVTNYYLQTGNLSDVVASLFSGKRVALLIRLPVLQIVATRLVWLCMIAHAWRDMAVMLHLAGVISLCVIGQASCQYLSRCLSCSATWTAWMLTVTHIIPQRISAEELIVIAANAVQSVDVTGHPQVVLCWQQSRRVPLHG